MFSIASIVYLIISCARVVHPLRYFAFSLNLQEKARAAHLEDQSTQASSLSVSRSQLPYDPLEPNFKSGCFGAILAFRPTATLEDQS